MLEKIPNCRLLGGRKTLLSIQLYCSQYSIGPHLSSEDVKGQIGVFRSSSWYT